MRVPVQQRAELHPELRLDGLQFVPELRNLFVLLAHLLLHRLMQSLDCCERDTFRIDRYECLLSSPSPKAARKSCAIGPMCRIVASCVFQFQVAIGGVGASTGKEGWRA